MTRDFALAEQLTVALICRRCSARMKWPEIDATSIECTCGAAYRCLSGIPDFRSTEDPYCGNGRDADIAADLHENAPNLTFEELLDRYYMRHCPELGPADVRRQIKHILEGPGAAEIDSQDLADISDKSILDLGCGSGSALIAFAERVKPTAMVGTDIAMRWLILARKRLDEAGLSAVRLVCCEGESMPFADVSFGTIHGGDVIEHVSDAEAVLSETARLLRPGGHAIYRTPNRLSLTREPHVGLYFAGWMPRNLAARYCRLMGAPPFQGIFTRTACGWKSAARTVSERHGNVDIQVTPAHVRQSSSGGLKGLYDVMLDRSAPFRAFATAFGPVLQIRLEKHTKAADAPAGPLGVAPGHQQTDRPVR